MALKGLSKNDRPVVEEIAKDFINGAQQRVMAHATGSKTKRVFERYTFSLTRSTSDEIDRLLMIPRMVRVNRSDIVKAGIEALGRLSEEELVSILMQVKQQT